MSLDTHLDGLQVLFDRPQEGIETVPMFLSRHQLFDRLELYFVRVVEEDSREDVPTTQVDGRCIYPPLAFGLGY